MVLPARLGALPPIQALQTRAGRLGFIVSGQGPAIVLFNGAGVTLDGWRALYPRIETLGRVFAWNRLGVQGSDAPAAPQTGTAVIASLRELLGYVGLAPPYVLVGHSLGGLYVNLFARLYPAETAGVLLLEATHPRDREVLKQHETQLIRALGRIAQLPQMLFKANVHSEMACIEDTVREIDAAGAFPPVPLRVVTGGRAPPPWMMSFAAAGARRAHQDVLAHLSPRGGHVIAHRSGHFPQLTEPKVVLDALASLVRAAKSGAPRGPASEEPLRRTG